LASGCASEKTILPELQVWCEQRTPVFGTPLGGSPADRESAQRFGDICLGLSRRDGLDFGEATITYACQTMLPRSVDPTGFRSAQAFEQASGRWKEL